MAKRFFIRRKDFKKLERYAENIYNTAVVIDYFCSTKVKFLPLETLIQKSYIKVKRVKL